MPMARIIKRNVPEHQWKFRKKYGLTRKTFYRVVNPVGETIEDFTNKKDAERFRKKLGRML